MIIWNTLNHFPLHSFKHPLFLDEILSKSEVKVNEKRLINNNILKVVVIVLIYTPTTVYVACVTGKRSIATLHEEVVWEEGHPPPLLRLLSLLGYPLVLPGASVHLRGYLDNLILAKPRPGRLQYSTGYIVHNFKVRTLTRKFNAEPSFGYLE